MADYSYQIGATVGGKVNVESLETDFPPPTGSAVKPFSVFRTTVGGLEYGDGFPETTWHFDFLTRTMLDTLLGYLSAAAQSGTVYINTRLQDGSYVAYSAIMHRPKQGNEMNWEIGGWREVTVRFTWLEAT